MNDAAPIVADVADVGVDKVTSELHSPVADYRESSTVTRVESAGGGGAFLDGVLTSALLDGTDFPRAWLVEPLLLQREPVIVGGPKKCLKSSLLTDLALSLATGTKFLGHFEVGQPMRVAIFSGESGQATIQETARRVCGAKGLRLADCEKVVWGFSLPRLSVPEDLDELGAYLREKKIGVAIIDPLYLCLLDGSKSLSPTNLFDIGPVLRRTSEICLSVGTTPVLVHHAGKGATARRNRNGEPLDLDDLAFAGITEFARQWLLVNRRRPYRAGTGRHELWMNVGGSAGQGSLSAVDVEEGNLGTDFLGRVWNVTVQRGEDLQAASSGDTKDQDARRMQKHAEARQAIQEFLAARRNGETESQICKGVGGSKNLVLDLLKEMADEGIVVQTKVSKPGGRGHRDYDGWKLALGMAEPAVEADQATAASGTVEGENTAT